MSPTKLQATRTVKLLTIIGFSATLFALIWIIATGVKNGPATFTYLASILKSMEAYEPDYGIESITSEVPSNTEIAPETREEIKTHTDDEKPPIETTSHNGASSSATMTDIRHTSPTLDSSGFIDLRVVMHGIGVQNPHIFVFTSHYVHKETYRVLIDIENTGTRLSSPWSFATTLGTKTLYVSPLQTPLRPQEHAIFSIPFVYASSGNLEISTVLYTSNDKNVSDNSARLTLRTR